MEGKQIMQLRRKTGLFLQECPPWSLRFFLVILGLFISFESQAFLFKDPELSTEESSQIIKILETFSNGCSLTKGPSADAIAVVQGLTSAIRSAMENPACKSLGGTMTSLDSSILQAHSLIPQVNDSYISELELQVNSLQKQKEEIETLLTQTTDSDEILSLRSDLYSVRIELAGAVSAARDSALNDQQIRRAQALRLLLSSSNQAINQILMNESCWVGQPSLLQQVAGVGSTLGASAALTTASSQKAVLLSAGLGILSTVVDFFDRLAKAKKLAQFDLALGSTALTCAMEKMNDVYCSAQDTLAAIGKVGQKLHDPKADPVWQGVGFLEKEIPTLLGWLQKIKSGGSAGTIDDSERQAAIELQEVNLTNSEKLFEGFLRHFKLRYDQTHDPETKFSIIRDMITAVGNRLCYDSYGAIMSSNPICKSPIPVDFAPFHLLGLSPKNYQDLLKINPNFKFQSLSLSLLSEIGIDGNLITLSSVREQFGKWYRLAREKFDIEKRLAVGQDLVLIFDEAYKKEYQVANPVTAQSSLEALITFLKLKRLQDQPVAQMDLRDQVVSVLIKVLNEIEMVRGKETTPERAKEVIFEIAQLKIGTSFLGDRLERLIRTDLEKLVHDSDELDDTTRLPILAANDVITELRRYYQVSSLQEMEEAAANAQLIMIKTVDPFIRLFATPIIRSFNEFDSIKKNVGGETGKRAMALKTKLCFYFLGSHRKRDFIMKGCEGLMAESVLGISTPVFGPHLFQMDLDKRACLYRQFIMKNRILERRRSHPKIQHPEFYQLLKSLQSGA